MDETFRAQLQNAAKYHALHPGQSAASITCLRQMLTKLAACERLKLFARARELAPRRPCEVACNKLVIIDS